VNDTNLMEKVEAGENEKQAPPQEIEATVPLKSEPIIGKVPTQRIENKALVASRRPLDLKVVQSHTQSFLAGVLSRVDGFDDVGNGEFVLCISASDADLKRTVGTFPVYG